MLTGTTSLPENDDRFVLKLVRVGSGCRLQPKNVRKAQTRHSQSTCLEKMAAIE
jgi:hypothetical protein